jgi:hypothetical protein
MCGTKRADPQPFRRPPTGARLRLQGPLSDGRPSRCVVPMALCSTAIRHIDVLLAVQGEGDRVADCRLHGRSTKARSRFQLTPESFIK